MRSAKDQKKILIAGLGNPGKKYQNTPHNIGFIFLDYLVNQWGAGSYQKKFNGSYLSTSLESQKLILLKPLTFMNLSGNAVKPSMLQNGILPGQLIVVHDEVDMLPGQWGVKEGGGHRGHNGLRHIMSCIGTGEFLRIRIGVGRPNHPDLADHLLSNYSRASFVMIQEKFSEIQSRLEELIRDLNLNS